MNGLRTASRDANSAGLRTLALAAWALLFLAAGVAQATSVTVLSSGDSAFNASPLGAITSDGTNLFVGGGTPSNQAGVFSLSIGGGAVTQLYTGWGPNTCCAVGLATIGSDVFWIDPNSGPITDTEVYRAPKNGSGPMTPIYTGSLVSQPIADGSDLTTDGTRLYSADFVQGRVHVMNADGTGLTQLGPSRYGGFFDREHRNLITEDGGLLYIADDGQASFGDTPPRIQAISTSGGSFSNLYLGAVGTTRAWNGIAVLGSSLFLTEGSSILSISTSGGTPTTFLNDAAFGTLNGITAFGGALYVAGSNAAGAPTVFRVSLQAPEPGTFALLALGLLGLGFRGARRG